MFEGSLRSQDPRGGFGVSWANTSLCTPDISLWIQHAWYHNVWDQDSDGESKIGKWLGVANGIGGGDCFWLLPMSARPIARSTVWNVTTDELTGAAVKETIRALDSSIDSKIGGSFESSDN